MSAKQLIERVALLAKRTGLGLTIDHNISGYRVSLGERCVSARLKGGEMRAWIDGFEVAYDEANDRHMNRLLDELSYEGLPDGR